MALCLVFMILYSTWEIDVSMISFWFRSQFISLYEHILQFYNLWYCDWLHTTLLETEMDPIRFHPESINGLPCQEFMRWFVFAIVVLLQIMMCICWALSLRSLTRNLFEIWRNLCIYFSRPLSWGVVFFSLRCLQPLVSLDILPAWYNRNTGAYPLLWKYQA